MYKNATQNAQCPHRHSKATIEMHSKSVINIYQSSFVMGMIALKVFVWVKEGPGEVIRCNEQTIINGQYWCFDTCYCVYSRNGPRALIVVVFKTIMLYFCLWGVVNPLSLKIHPNTYTNSPTPNLKGYLYGGCTVLITAQL